MGKRRYWLAALLLICSCRDATPESSEHAQVKTDFVAPRYAEIVGGSGKNLAYDRDAATVDPRLTAHSRKMAQHIYRSAGNVYSAVGYGLANMIMIEGSDGIVIVDPLEALENAREVMTEFRKITDKPVKGVIYTHNHYDHVMGVQAVVSREDVAAGKVPIYAQRRLMEGLLNQLSVVGEAILARSMYSFGAFLDKGPEGSVNEGIGPLVVQGTPSFLPPTVLFDDSLEVSFGSVTLQLIYSPSETDDELVIWIAATRTLLSAEVIQGETFPNLYTIRGTTFRNPVAWYKTIDRLRELGAEHMVPSHGRPVEGRAEIDGLLTAYRDAIQFAHDQTVRLINKGYTPDEIADALPRLPAHLAAHPWLNEFYGTVKHSVRAFYVGYLGWFEADPTALDPLPPRERAERYVKLMGGRDAVLDAAEEAFEHGDLQWCAELLTYVIRIDPDDSKARQLKARALRQLGYKQANINWRNFYLTAALELEGTLDLSRYDRKRGIALFANLPIIHLLENLPTRIDAEKAREVRMTLAIHFTDSGKSYALEIRRGIVQIHDQLPAHVDVGLTTTEETLRGVLLRESSFLKEWTLRRIAVEGELSEVSRFFDYFEPASDTPPKLVAR